MQIPEYGSDNHLAIRAKSSLNPKDYIREGMWNIWGFWICVCGNNKFKIPRADTFECSECGKTYNENDLYPIPDSLDNPNPGSVG